MTAPVIWGIKGVMASVRRKNFGGNLLLQPASSYTPASEEEVLRILDGHSGERIRAVGGLHSWSEAPVADGVLLDLRRLNHVEMQQDAEGPVAVVGAGCRIKRLLEELDRQGGSTLPSLGLITQQTIAGAISTGTHGSGRNSMSHYVEGVRVARYDPATGKAIIEELNAGDGLRAARCSLGSLGIILTVRIRCRTQYDVEERFSEHRLLADVLGAEASFPLQQFFLVPWRWSYVVQHRREGTGSRSRLAWLYRIYWLLVLDVGLHLLVLFFLRVVRSRRLIRLVLRRVVSLFVIRGWTVTDRSSSMLVMRHDLFRHIEIELFVRRPRLDDALHFAKEVLEVAGGVRSELSTDNQRRLGELGMQDDLAGLRGRYCHHYPICVRRVLPDDTLISMASGAGEDWYALSFISYGKPKDRGGFFLFAGFMARSMSGLFEARPHWGKVCPLDAGELASLYPRFSDFRALCHRFDPDGVFRNRWTASLLDTSTEARPGAPSGCEDA